MILVAVFSLLIAIISIILSLKTKKKYERLVMKLGNGQKLNEIIEEYISQVNELEKKDDQIIEYCNKINTEVNKSIKKIGFIKYNLYSNTKNDLSFALALLNNENTGIVINSIYSADNSNVYAKNIINGSYEGKLSEEEKQAIKIAMEK